jgi:hypothetical protein
VFVLEAVNEAIAVRPMASMTMHWATATALSPLADNRLCSARLVPVKLLEVRMTPVPLLSVTVMDQA